MQQRLKYLVVTFSVLLSTSFVHGESIVEQLLRIDTIEITGNYRVSDAEITALAGLDPKVKGPERQTPWSWEVSPSTVKDRLERNPWIEEATVSRSLTSPTAVHISVKEAQPWLIAHMSGDSWVVSRTGRFIEPLSTAARSDQRPEAVLEMSELPRIELTPSSLDDPNRSFESAVQVIELFETAGGFPFKVERFHFPDRRTLELYPDDSKRFPTVRLLAPDLPSPAESGSKLATSLEKHASSPRPQPFTARDFREASDKLSELRATLADLASKNEHASVIDLRFSSQAIVRLVETPQPKKPDSLKAKR